MKQIIPVHIDYEWSTGMPIMIKENQCEQE